MQSYVSPAEAYKMIREEQLKKLRESNKPFDKFRLECILKEEKEFFENQRKTLNKKDLTKDEMKILKEQIDLMYERFQESKKDPDSIFYEEPK